MAIFMKYGAVNGGSTSKGLEKWIELESFQFGLDQPMSGTPGGPQSNAPHATFSDIAISKVTDIASTVLMSDAWRGKHTDKVQFRFTTTDVGSTTVFMEVELSDCVISHFDLLGKKTGNPIEELRMSYTRIDVTHFGVDSKARGTPMRVGFDLRTLKST
jgi:type VI secretion system secreted protein Hcp